MNNIFYSPENFGLVSLGSLELDGESYEFHYLAVWKDRDGRVLFATDSGCSCPSPFEDTTVESLEVLATDYRNNDEPKWNILAARALSVGSGVTPQEVADWVTGVKARYAEVSAPADVLDGLTGDLALEVLRRLLDNDDYNSVAVATRSEITWVVEENRL